MRKTRLYTIALILLTLGGCQTEGNQGIAIPNPVMGGLHVISNLIHFVAHAPDDCPVCALYDRHQDAVVRIRTKKSMGTGIVISSEGTILTNAHVVEGADRIIVETVHGTITTATIVRLDAEADLALLKTDSPDVRWIPIEMGPHDPLRVGSTIYVIGHPVGLGWTVTQGLVSAHRVAGTVAPIDLIQTDAAISPGNSGGPVLNDKGQLVGVVRSKLIGVGMESIAFAIPYPVIKRFIENGNSN